MPRVLVTEELAERGLDHMRAAGLEVDVRLGLSPEELVAAVPGAAALVIRSATQVTADVLAAGDGPRRRRARGHRARQRRRRRGDPARRDGRQRAAVERDLRRGAGGRAAARHGPQHPAGRRRPQGREVEPLALVGGRAPRQDPRRRRPRPRRCARRPALPLVRHAPRRLRPVRERGAGAPARCRARARPRAAHARSADFLTIHLPKTPETLGLFDAEMLAEAQPSLRIVNTARGGIIDEAALAAALARRHDRGRGARRVRRPSRPPSHRCSACRTWWSRRTSARRRWRPRTRRARRSRRWWCSRWPASSCRSR